MGSWRKVGAFLGLMPEDGRRDEYGEEYPDGQYHDGAYPEGYEGDRAPEYDDHYDHGRQSPYQSAPRSLPAYEPPMTQGALAVQARPEVDAEFCEPHRPESPLLRASTLAALLLVIATTIGCDRVTKHVAETTLVGQPIQSYFADTVRLQFTQNPGAFLGLGADWSEGIRTAFFTGGNAVLLTMLIVAAVRLRWSGPALLGLAFFVAGGASNLADRLARGTVTDFINVGVGPLRPGIFNVADVAIMLGAALVPFGSFRSRDHH